MKNKAAAVFLGILALLIFSAGCSEAKSGAVLINNQSYTTPEGVSVAQFTAAEITSGERVKYLNSVLNLTQTGNNTNNLTAVYNVVHKKPNETVAVNNKLVINQTDGDSINNITVDILIRGVKSIKNLLVNDMTVVIQGMGNFTNSVTQNFVVQSNKVLHLLLNNLVALDQAFANATNNVKTNVIVGANVNQWIQLHILSPVSPTHLPATGYVP